MQFNLDAVPDDLKRWRQWVVWRFVQRGEKRTKPPFCPTTGRLASVDNPDTWASFEQACQAFSKGQYTGLAFILTPWDPFVGIDLDHAVEEGRITLWAQSIIDHFGSYTEWSPSHTGVHIWIRGSLPGPRRRKGSIEMYQDFRSLTLTGWHLEGTPLQIGQRQEEMEDYYRHLFPPEEPRQLSPSAPPQLPTNMSDADLLERAMRARNGFRFARLWAGDTEQHKDHSSADLALCGYLAFWTRGDAARIDRLFRQSGLMRSKWDQIHYSNGDTYGQRTITLALAGLSNTTHVMSNSSKVRR